MFLFPLWIHSCWLFTKLLTIIWHPFLFVHRMRRAFAKCFKSDTDSITSWLLLLQIVQVSKRVLSNWKCSYSLWNTHPLALKMKDILPLIIRKPGEVVWCKSEVKWLHHDFHNIRSWWMLWICVSVSVFDCGRAIGSGTEAADASVDAQGCREEVEKGLKAIACLWAELWTMAWSSEEGCHGRIVLFVLCVSGECVATCAWNKIQI